MPNPKVFRRLTPCKLIGYAPNSKAYCLWDPTTAHMFNSFHVEFVEHLNAMPYKLLPGVMAGVDTNTVHLPYDTQDDDLHPSPNLTFLLNTPIIIPDSETPFLPNVNETIPNTLCLDSTIENTINNDNTTTAPSMVQNTPPNDTNTVQNDTNTIQNPVLPPLHPLCHSSHIPIPTTQGLEPNSRLMVTRAEVATSAACQ